MLTKHNPCLRGNKNSQHMLTTPFPCQWRHKIHLNMCWPNTSHQRKGTKLISTWVDQSQLMTARPTKCISTCVDQTPPNPARKQNVFQLEMFKHLPCQQEHEIYLNVCWPNTTNATQDRKCFSKCLNKQNANQHVLTKSSLDSEVTKCISTSLDQPYHASEDRKCISSVVDETHPMTARTQNAF